MSTYNYDRLTFLDNTFLLGETPTTPMHVAGTATFEIGPLRAPEGGLDIDRIRDFINAKLHLIPRYRQKLAYVPIENQPVWVDDHHFNIHYHVRHTSLPKPGDQRQLKRLAARVMAQHLDRSKPLWEIWFVEGLENPEHFAMIQKIHHCMIDGMSSVDLLNVLLDKEPSTNFPKAPRWIPRPVPSSAELATDAVRRYLRLPLEIGRLVPNLLDPESEVRERIRALATTVQSNLRTVAATPLNRPIGPHRRFDWLMMDLATIKNVKNRLGGTVNDVVLTTVAGAIRSFLKRRGVKPEGLDFRVMAPVSVRKQEERGALGNRVSAWAVPLPIGEVDPIKRLDLIRETTEELKESQQALGAEVLSQVLEWTPSTLLSLGARLMPLAPLPFNLVVTNVPGPQTTLYLLGAKMLDNYGFIPLTNYLALGIVLYSYAGKLCWGFTAEWDLLPDLHELVRDVEKAFQQLLDTPERDIEPEVKYRAPAGNRRGQRASRRR